jgi:antitoxin HicB
MAAEALESAMEFYFDDGALFRSRPSRKDGASHWWNCLSAWLQRCLLLNEMIQQKVRPAELARRLKTTPQEVNRLTNIRHASKIDGIAVAMKALGKTLEIRAV